MAAARQLVGFHSKCKYFCFCGGCWTQEERAAFICEVSSGDIAPGDPILERQAVAASRIAARCLEEMLARPSLSRSARVRSVLISPACDISGHRGHMDQKSFD